jgi:hypothetical protein
MGDVKTNKVTMAYGVEPTFKADPTEWYNLQPNDISTFGSSISKTQRSPISPTRQNQKSFITDLDSSVEFEADTTISAVQDFTEGFVFSSFDRSVMFEYTPTSVTATDFIVAANGDLAADTLVFARGFDNAANNGLHVVGAGATTTDIEISGGLTAETPTGNPRLEVCGVQGASGDIEIDVTGPVVSITSTTLDFTTLGLKAGQLLHVGGVSTDTNLNFATAANRGAVRVVSVATNAIVIDKTPTTFVTDAGAGKTIQLIFGPFLKNVAITDPLYAETSFQFEAFYPGLDVADAYEYAIGNFCNEMTINVPLTDKSTISYGFIGADTENPVTTAKTGTHYDPDRVEPVNTTADVIRVRLQESDETELSTYVKSVNLVLSNEVTAEKVIGSLGAAFMNFGNFVVTGEIQILFTNVDVVTEIRNNSTVTMDFILKNPDGAIGFDIPSMTLGDGAKEFTVNETVKINLNGEAFQDAVLGTSIGITHFPHYPS